MKESVDKESLSEKYKLRYLKNYSNGSVKIVLNSRINLIATFNSYIFVTFILITMFILR